MKIAAIVCTYNRCETLAWALESLAASSMPESARWRVLVVDNNSSDNTRAVVEDFAHRFPGRFEYVFEPHQGKSHALNRGVQLADADVVAFTDDDVRVDPHWLHNITAALASTEWSGTAGRILPDSDFVPPRWLDVAARYSMAPLAMFNPAMSPGEINEPPFGANMAYRTEMFSKYGGFRLDLGPQPGGDIKNEDVEFGGRLLAAGKRIWYEPSAIVYHSVPSHRVRKSYFLTWWYGKARSDVRQSGASTEQSLSVLGIPVDQFLRLILWSLRWLLAFHSARRFTCKINVWSIVGRMRECFAQFCKSNHSHIPRSQSTQ